MSEPKWHRWIGPIIFLVALGFRLMGIGWGLPNALHNQSYHPDEQVIWQFSQGIEPAKLDFSPGVYNYGTLYLTTLRVASDMVAAYTGGIDPKDPQSVWDYMKRCHLAGRWISALCGAGLAFLVFLIGRRFLNTFAAALSGLAIAFAPSLVVHSRFQTTDMLATLLFAASLGFSLKLLARDNDGWHRETMKICLLAGFLAGLSAGAKYTGILALATLAAACLLYNKAQWWRAFLAGVGASLVGFLIATPGALVDSSRFLRDFKYEMMHTSTGHGLHFLGVSNGFLYHLSNLVSGLSPLIVILGAVGLVGACRARVYPVLALLPSFVLYFLLIGRAEVLFMRYTFPLYVAMALGFGWFAQQASRKSMVSILTGAIGILAVGGAATIAGRATEPMVEPEARDLAALYIKNESAGKNWTAGFVSDPWYYTPPLFKDTALIRGLFVEQMAEAAKVSEPRVIRYTPANPEERVDWDTRLLDQSPEFVVFSSFEAGDVARLVKTNVSPVHPDAQRFKEFLARLEVEYTEIGPGAVGDPLDRYFRDGMVVHDMHYVRPQIYLWKRKGL